MSAKKGSAFERQICKDLSKWWSAGKRDDIFWRSSQSGGRATQRAKFGKKTFGSYGDITAVDPIGQPLMKAFTIELKRGRSHGCLADLIDTPDNRAKHTFKETLHQTITAHQLAGSLSWMLIARRDCKRAFVCLEVGFARLLFLKPVIGSAQFLTRVKGMDVRFVVYPLDLFLKHVAPKAIQRLV